MIKIENVEVTGWEHAIRGMRNPKNSWERSDSRYDIYCDDERCEECPERGAEPRLSCCDRLNMHHTKIGPNDHELMMQLAAGGAVHAKYRRMITVYLDITAPLYWWKEFDTYKVGTVANSCSTMHKIDAKEFTLEDFSCEHLHREEVGVNTLCYTDAPLIDSTTLMELTIEMLNYYRKCFIEDGHDKEDWWQMIQLLPSSYNQKRTVMLNYEVLTNMYESRLFHKLDEWNDFCKWIETLPYSEIITGVDPFAALMNEPQEDNK